MDNPRLGLVLLRADWVGRDSAPGLQGAIEDSTRDMTGVLEQHFNLQGPWVIDSSASLQECMRRLREADLDLVVLAYQTWAEDRFLISLLQAIGSNPLVLWNYLPWHRLPRPASQEDLMSGSGTVGAFGALGTLHNLNAPFLYVYGAPDDPRLVNDLLVAGRAARVRRKLREARFGLVPSRNDEMQCTFVDEFRLMAEIGPVVKYISVGDFHRMVDGVADDELAGYLARLERHYPSQGITKDMLREAARAALGLARLAEENELDVLGLNESSPELQRLFHMRPAVFPALLETNGALFQSEGDLGAATASLILHMLTGSPTMLFEIWFWDEAKNQVIGGHNGLQNPEMAQPGEVSLSLDGYWGRSPDDKGVQFHFIARPGRATLFQLRSTPKGWQAIAASGICLESLPWVNSCPYAVLRLDAHIDQFLKRVAGVGATQHWILAYGSVLPEIEAYCQMTGIPLELLAY